MVGFDSWVGKLEVFEKKNDFFRFLSPQTPDFGPCGSSQGRKAAPKSRLAAAPGRCGPQIVAPAEARASAEPQFAVLAVYFDVKKLVRTVGPQERAL